MKRYSVMFLLSLAVACTNGSPVDPEPVSRDNCGLGPIAIVPISGEACNVNSRCPLRRRANAQTMVAVSTCGFGADASGCTPVQNPGCPFTGERQRIFFKLANPDRPGSICTGDVRLDIETLPGGGARVFWHAEELEDAPSGGCRLVGSELAGEATVQGPCCERTIDIPLPNARRTFRVVVRTDWQ